ncbi:hypothetical protein GCM10012287_29950 [Streptomyces daqingensis]|uniref:Uncharacterized protein n=1 Tax=Streptomyces daqingensis TaxID=1472640 RepID=A0ABQ2MF41_9ACTN|nr:hypothetical protein GCM10012287_29950 [Streptomyces daqingensis]
MLVLLELPDESDFEEPEPEPDEPESEDFEDDELSPLLLEEVSDELDDDPLVELDVVLRLSLR